jgi:hypothetical protein
MHRHGTADTSHNMIVNIRCCSTAVVALVWAKLVSYNPLSQALHTASLPAVKRETVIYSIPNHKANKQRLLVDTAGEPCHSFWHQEDVITHQPTQHCTIH